MKYKNKNLHVEIPFSEYIWEMEGSLKPEFCDRMIEKFEVDDLTYEGMIGDSRVDKRIKSTLDLQITDHPKWKEEDETLFNALSYGLNEYYSHVLKISKNYIDLRYMIDRYTCNDTGYQIQRYEPGGYYEWHQDFRVAPHYGSRQITYIWYLNTIKDGTGYTEFCDGTRVQPKKGKLVCFPSSWQYLHRAYPSKKKRKYICTGWLHANTSTEES
tara:strand:- start:59 stop:700 length:642 start_codon:yes stop_codon:yes gene_type:complete